ncbi:methyltransferase domain-containing protein [Leptospira ilyithenensis]|nr:methyltransferase domain-containing protein [Leptospira ilyithenensis]
MAVNKDSSYFRFNSLGLSSLAERSLKLVRQRIYNQFAAIANVTEKIKVLDVGVSAQDHPSSNFFEQYFPYKNNITALGLGDFKELEKIYPGLTYVKGDGRILPFSDKSFDWVFSHAVIEHVGNSSNQEAFIAELIRVSKKGVFLTSPNRLHPLEFHTGLPLFHYFPKALHLKIYKILGQSFYCTEENLNLLFPSDFKDRIDAAFRLIGVSESAVVKRNFAYWLGLPSNTLYSIILT